MRSFLVSPALALKRKNLDVKSYHNSFTVMKSQKCICFFSLVADELVFIKIVFLVFARRHVHLTNPH